MTPSKKNNRSPEIDPDLKEIHEMPEKQFRIVAENFNEMQGNKDILFKEVRKTTHGVNEKFEKPIGTLNSNQSETVEQKVSINEIQNSVESFNEKTD